MAILFKADGEKYISTEFLSNKRGNKNRCLGVKYFAYMKTFLFEQRKFVCTLTSRLNLQEVFWGILISFLLSILLCKDVSYGKVWSLIDILLDIQLELTFMCNPSFIYCYNRVPCSGNVNLVCHGIYLLIFKNPGIINTLMKLISY